MQKLCTCNIACENRFQMQSWLQHILCMQYSMCSSNFDFTLTRYTALHVQMYFAFVVSTCSGRSVCGNTSLQTLEISKPLVLNLLKKTKGKPQHFESLESPSKQNSAWSFSKKALSLKYSDCVSTTIQCKTLIVMRWWNILQNQRFNQKLKSFLKVPATIEINLKNFLTVSKQMQCTK